MRRALILAFLAILSCGDPAPRDRTAIERLRPPGASASPAFDCTDPLQPGRVRSPDGLLTDPLAALYPKSALYVLRFEAPAALIREAVPQCRELAALLPTLGIPDRDSTDLLRSFLGLPDSVGFDPRFPFALARVRGGWIGIVAVPHRAGTADRITSLGPVYCAAGEPDLLASYRRSGGRGSYLPGDCSLIVGRDGVSTLAADLRTFGSGIGVEDPPVLTLPASIERFDGALRFDQGGLRLDLRLGAKAGSEWERRFLALRPHEPETQGWLPDDGTLYFDSGSPLLALAALRGTRLPPAGQGALQLLGGDFGLMLDLDPDGRGTLLCVARVQSAELVRAWLGSDALAGLEGVVEWNPRATEQDGVAIGVLRGRLGPKRTKQWRERGILWATLAAHLQGDVEAYVALVGERLCFAAGPRSRAEVDALIRRLKGGQPAPTRHTIDARRLFVRRAASFSVDLAALFDGSRIAAKYWPGRGGSLEDLSLRWRLPAAGALTVQGGSLRLALRLRPRRIADAALRIIEAAAGPSPQD